jgi:hypothetical protein
MSAEVSTLVNCKTDTWMDVLSNEIQFAYNIMMVQTVSAWDAYCVWI